MAGDYFKGYISTVRMYNRALSESEVRTLAREWKKPVPDAPVGTSGILISSSDTISAGKFHKNESAEIPSSGLLLHASLEQDSETAETGQTFTKSGNVTFETVQGMKCAHFDGNSYWQVPFESDLAGNTTKAVSLWMRGTKNTANGSWQEAAVVAFGYWRSGEAFAIEHLSSSTVSNRIHGKIYGDGDVTTYDNSAIEDFHHVVFQYDTEKTQLFIDGQLFGTVTYSSLNTASNYPLTIGWNAMRSGIKFTGYISGVRVYNRALSEMEIQNLSNEWQRTGRTNKIFIPVMDKIETEPTMFEKIVAAVNENSGIQYTATASEFGDFSDSSKWNGGVLAPNGKIYGIPYNSTTVLEIDSDARTATTFGSLFGSEKWNGGVLAPNGKIYGIPRESEAVLEIDPVTQTATTFGNVEKPSSGIAYIGGVLAPNGKIYAIPYNAGTILKIDPEARTVSTFGSFSESEKWSGGVLAPNGKIYGIPYGSSSVLEIDPETDSISTFGSLSGSSKWDGGVLAPNGKIYGIPRSSSKVLEIYPLTRSVSTFGSISSSGAKWSGGVLAPNGKIYGIPRDSRMILEINPETRTASTFQSLSSSGNKWRGGTLAPNGKIYAIPFNTSTILEISFDWSGQPFTTEICTSSYLNKF